MVTRTGSRIPTSVYGRHGDVSHAAPDRKNHVANWVHAIRTNATPQNGSTIDASWTTSETSHRTTISATTAPRLTR